MTLKFISRAARLLGFILSPLLTAPAAAADLDCSVLATTLCADQPAAVHVVGPARSVAGRGQPFGML